MFLRFGAPIWSWIMTSHEIQQWSRLWLTIFWIYFINISDRHLARKIYFNLTIHWNKYILQLLFFLNFSEYDAHITTGKWPWKFIKNLVSNFWILKSSRNLVIVWILYLWKNRENCLVWTELNITVICKLCEVDEVTSGTHFQSFLKYFLMCFIHNLLLISNILSISKNIQKYGFWYLLFLLKIGNGNYWYNFRSTDLLIYDVKLIE